MENTQSPALLQSVAELRRQTDEALEHYAALGDGCPANLQEAIRYCLLAPGKRLRPLLVLMGAEACGGTIEAALPAACAVEMVHAYSLIHDDLPSMDDDDLRRGQPTCHKKFGEAMAILAGDALLTLAFEVLSRDVQPPEAAAACCRALAQAAGAGNMVGGQADDIAGLAPESGLETLESIHHRKTGAMIEVSLQLGALTAEADAERQAVLQQFGRQIGLAFQITDDLLDVRADEQTIGKRVGKDAQLGKLTFPGLLGIDASQARAEQLVQEACQSLAPLSGRTERLEALAHYVLERNR